MEFQPWTASGKLGAVKAYLRNRRFNAFKGHEASMKNMVERRRYKRFRVKGGIFASFTPHWLRSIIVGEILDISRGGLALHYIPGPEQSNRVYKLRILVADGSFCLSKIPSRTVSDLEIKKRFSFGSMPARRSGVQFGELTPSQLSLLKYFILNYTMNEE